MAPNKVNPATTRDPAALSPPEDPRTDLELIEAVNNGDDQAFAILYARHRDWVLRVAHRYLTDDSLALDVLQETFVYFFRKFPGFQLTCRLRTFLFPAIRNLSLNILRRRQRDQHTEPSDLDKLMAPEAAGIPDTAEAGHARLAEVLRLLPQSQREVLLLRFVDGFSLQEIAEALVIPPGTVKSRLHHGLNTLRKSPGTRRYFEPFAR